MNYPWLDEYLLSKPGAEKDYKPEWDAVRYMLRGKMFCMMAGDKEGKPIASFKLEPEYGAFLREQYKGDIIPGYYMNKEHWNSLYVKSHVPEEIVRDMADRSHRLILASLSKKAQKEILG